MTVPVFAADDFDFVDLVGRRSANPIVESGSDCSIRLVEIRPGPRTPHRHPHSCEVVYVADGEGRLWEGDRSTAVTAGDVALVEAGVAHATVCTGGSTMRLVCFFPHPDLSKNLEELDGPVRG